jgi:hypothetical protein
MSVGPALAGIFQEANQAPVEGVSGLFPTENAYNLIFITAALVSMASVAMAISVVRRKVAPAMAAPSSSSSGDDPHKAAGMGGGH